MNLLLDAKRRIGGWEGILTQDVLHPFLLHGLSAIDAKQEEIEEFFLPLNNEYKGISIPDFNFFLQLEDTLLTVADYILDKRGLREFDKAILIEKIRQYSLLPLLKENPWLCEMLGTSPSNPVLKRNTPKGL